MIDPSKVKVGDTLIAYLMVTDIKDGKVAVALPPTSAGGGGDLRLESLSGYRYFKLGRFAEHVPAPRKIEVGSRVVWRSKSRPGVVAAYERTVVAIGHAQFGDVCVSTPIGTLHIVNEQELEVVD